MAYDRKEVKGMSQDELKAFIPTKMKELEEVAGPNGEKLKTLDPAGVEDFQSRNEELKEANIRFSSLRAASDAFKEQQEEYKKEFKTVDRKGLPFGEGEGGKDPDEKKKGDFDPNDYKTLGELFTESKQYLAIQQKAAPEGKLIQGAWDPKVDGNLRANIPNVSLKSLEFADTVKATMMTTTGWPPYPTMGPRPPVLTAVQQPVVADLVPQDDTTQPSILYYEETTYTENADWVAEGGPKPEAALGLTLRNQPVCKLAVMLPISEEQAMDVPQVRGYIDGRLKLMLKRKEEAGLLRGTGTPPQIRGFHNVVGIGSIAKAGTEDNPDAILRAITDVNSIQGYANASGVVMNPLQWLAIRLLRTQTGDYIWGHPALQGPATLWGLPVIPTNAETAGVALVGDFAGYSHISRRLGIRVDIGYINDDFQKDIERIRMEERLCLEVYRAKAFEEVTALNAAP